jgi:cell wall-associated NlpC family hydrolase
MGRHHRKSRRKSGPALLLGLSFLSVGSPLGLLASIQEKANADPRTTAPIPIVPPATLKDVKLDLAQGVREARQAVKLPSSSTHKTEPPVRPATTTTTPRVRTRAPISTPMASVSTRPNRPTVVERQIQRATTTTSTAVPSRPPTTPSPKPQIARKTATSPTSSSPSPPPPLPATTPPPPKPQPKPPPAPKATGIVGIAKSYVGRGIPYRMGGNSLTGGMDCSHFVWRVLKEAGYTTQYRDSDGLAAWVQRTSNPQPGDLVLYNGHVGIYAGNGMMIDQGRSGGAFFRKIYKENFIGYGRMPI